MVRTYNKLSSILILTVTLMLSALLLIVLISTEVRAEQYEIDLSFNSKNDYNCNISIDDKVKTYKFKESENYDKRIDNNFSINCNQTLKTFNFNLLDEDHNIVKSISKNNINNYDYKLQLKELSINAQDIQDCSIYIDGNVKDSKSDYEFLDKFSLKCQNAQDIELYVENDSRIIFFDELYNISNFNYDKNTISKRYYTTFYFTDNFNKSNKCNLKTDTITLSKTYYKKTRLTHFIIENKVGNEIHLKCEENIEKIQMFIDDRFINKEYYSQEFYNVSEVKLNIDNIEIEPIEYTFANTTKQEVKEVISKEEKQIIIYDLNNRFLVSESKEQYYIKNIIF